MTDPLALDTSLAVPLLVGTHKLHAAVTDWLGDQPAVLSGHAAVETYSVLTRLPGDLRQPPDVVVRVIESRFLAPVVLPAASAARLQHTFADAGITGGAVYDGLVGLAALENGLVLATRDRRAADTYRALHVTVMFVS